MNVHDAIKKFGTMINSIVPKNKHKIMFESNSDYCDNTRAVYDFMQAQEQENSGFKYKYVWCVNDPKTFDSSKMLNTKITSFHSKRYALSYLFHLYTSAVVMYTHFVPPFCSQKAQTVVNLWHGTPLKSIKGHCHKSELFSYIVSPSTFCSSLIFDSFEMDKEEEDKLIFCGYPRNDILFSKRDVLVNLDIKKQDFSKVILWMPTFRKPIGAAFQDGQASDTGIPLITDPNKFEELNNQLQSLDILLIIKLHPGQDLSGIRLTDMTNLKMLTNSDLAKHDIQPYELVACFDALLTDYSSIFFDYLLLDRPIGFIIDDFDSYDQNRGFTVLNPLEIMPGAKIKTIPQLFSFLDDVKNNIDTFAEERHKINDLVNKYQDADNSKRLLEKIKIEI